MPDDLDAVDRIRLSGITVTGYHGVLDDERRDGQTFVADVVLHVDTRAAAEADRLDLTVDYGALSREVAGVLGGSPVDLLETLAERIAAVVLDHDAVRAVDVVVHKPQAPLPVPFGDVAVEIHRDRVHVPAVTRRAPGAAAASAGPVPASAGLTIPYLDDSPPVPGLVPGPVTVPMLAPVTGPAPVPVPGPVLAQVPVPGLAPALDQAPVPVPGPVSAQVPGPVLAPVPAPVSVPVLAPVSGPVPVPVSGPVSGPVPVPVPAGAASGGAHVLEPVAPPPPQGDPADRMDVVPDGPVGVVLGLGSNVGASQDTLRDAIVALRGIEGLEVGAIAPLARTAAVGGPEQPDYLNTIVMARTVLSPRGLLHACQEVETRFGRVREERWAPRTLDIDLIMHGSTVGGTDDLELPHPRAHERSFVLAPWAHVDPTAVLPGLGGGPVAMLAETAPDRDGIRWMALDWWGAEESP